MADPQSPGAATPELAGLANLGAEAEILGQHLQQANPASRSHTGYDSTGRVGITVDGPGVVRAVDVDDSWRRSIDPRSFHSAIQEAVNNALVDHANWWAESRETDPARQGNAGPGTYDSVDEEITTDKTPDRDPGTSRQEAQDSIAEVLTLLEHFNHDLADFEHTLRESAAQPVAGSGSGGHVTVRLTGGQPTAIDVDANWVSNARPPEINGEVLSAFEAAHAQSSAARVTPETFGRSVGRLHELASNPQLLIRRLGLG